MSIVGVGIPGIVTPRFDTDEMGVSDEDVMYLIKKLEGYVAARPDVASV